MFKTNQGITLIALIVTIIIMLILAGVTIAVVIDGGLFSQAKEAADKMKMAAAREQVEMMLGEYAIVKQTEGITLSEFLQRKTDENELDLFDENGDADVYLVEKDGHEFEINKEEEKIVAGEKSGGLRPNIAYDEYQINGEALVDGTEYAEVIITIKVTNKPNLTSVDEIVFTGENGIVNAESTVTGEGEASYKVPGLGKYMVKVTRNKRWYTKIKDNKYRKNKCTRFMGNYEFY